MGEPPKRANLRFVSLSNIASKIPATKELKVSEVFSLDLYILFYCQKPLLNLHFHVNDCLNFSGLI